jgi:hypothetical protein
MYGVVGRSVILIIVITNMTLAVFELEKVVLLVLPQSEKAVSVFPRNAGKAATQKISREPNKVADKAKLVLNLISITTRISVRHDGRN